MYQINIISHCTKLRLAAQLCACAIQVQMPFGIVEKEKAALDEFQSVLLELQIYLQKLSYLRE